MSAVGLLQGRSGALSAGPGGRHSPAGPRPGRGRAHWPASRSGRPAGRTSIAVLTKGRCFEGLIEQHPDRLFRVAPLVEQLDHRGSRSTGWICTSLIAAISSRGRRASGAAPGSGHRAGLAAAPSPSISLTADHRR